MPHWRVPALVSILAPASSDSTPASSDSTPASSDSTPASSYNENKYILTTVEKAKFVKPFAEKLITLAKNNTLHNYRRGLKLLDDEDAVKTLFDDIGPAYRERPGGYTRIVRTAKKRLGDKASMALFGFVLDRPAEAVAVADDASAEESSE
ncbi:MAG: 50S ribosomal protein L17 [Planctomycetes bacterium]|nr:50S ribosomal protein L17 [Planctomycetota bacterium]